MKFEIVAMGKIRNKHLKLLTQEYLNRLTHYVQVAHTELRETRVKGAVSVVLAQEAERMRDRCGSHTIKVALDERGRMEPSVEFAARCESWMTHGARHIAFFIGSAHGLDPDFRQECDAIMALSPMTLPHEMARMLLSEQLYRAMTIVRGEPYHK